MASLIGTYTYDWDRAIAGYGDVATMGKAILWNLVHQLTGQLQGGTVPGAWTVVGSSDGSTAGMDGTNRWWNGGTFSAALMPHATGSSAHSWIVLQSPVALSPRLWLLFDYNNSTLNSTCPLARASFAAFSGGSITAAPTSATSFTLGTSASTPSGWLVAAGSAALHKTHLSLASDGAFFWGASRTGASFRVSLAVCKLLDTPANDGYPVVTFKVDHTDAMQLGANNAFPASSSSPASVASSWSAVFAEQDSGGGSASDYANAHPWAGRTPTGSYLQRLRPIMPHVRWSGTSDATFHNYGGALCAMRQVYPEWPIWLASVSSGSYGLRGRVRDLFLATGIAELTVEPSGVDPITRAVWGSFWIPADRIISF